MEIRRKKILSGVFAKTDIKTNKKDENFNRDDENLFVFNAPNVIAALHPIRDTGFRSEFSLLPNQQHRNNSPW
jgi:hypothetical protein